MSAIAIWYFVKKFWPFLLIAAVVLSVAGYIGVQKVRLHLAQNRLQAQEILRLEEINARTAASFARYVADTERGRAAAVARENRRVSDAAIAAPIIQEITNAPASDDGPIAPVVRDALAGLRAAQGLGGHDLHSTAPAAGEPAAVRDSPADPEPGDGYPANAHRELR